MGILAREVLTGEQQHLLVEATDHWNLRLLGVALTLLLACGRSASSGASR